jgi:hypothetical protein
MPDPRFTGRLIPGFAAVPLEVIKAGTVRSGLYLCQLPDFAAWVAAYGAELTDNEVEELGARRIRYPCDVRVPKDNSIDLANFLDQGRREAACRAVEVTLPRSEKELTYVSVDSAESAG